VLLLIGALLASTALPGVAAFLQAGRDIGVIAVIGDALSLALGFVPPLAAIAAMVLVYRFVPAEAPRWSAAGWPAITVGIALTVLARVFVFVAPRLIGSAALLGTLATAFAALAWLALSFQGRSARGGVGSRSSRPDAPVWSGTSRHRIRLNAAAGSHSAGRSGRWPRAKGRMTGTWQCPRSA